MQHRIATMARCTLRDLPKSNVFTTHLPADAAFATPAASHHAPREALGPRTVASALYTYVRPDPEGDAELLAISPRALSDLGLADDEASTNAFRDTVAGRAPLNAESIYPWAQCYGGYQFGQWAGQLGDGRAISLFETTNTATGIRYELQLKGAGRTPYSRFADGRAVLRSSIREFVVSEALHALGIPTTRALALTLNRGTRVRRERLEPGAIVARFAPSWIRLGTFDLPHRRRDRATLRTLANYTAEHVYGGWDQLPTAVPTEVDDGTIHTHAAAGGLAQDVTEGSGPQAQNRYARLYRAIARRNATTVASWQAYGFINGVLNTDNTSILGLSIDFGPFAFLDTFDPTYTPNHDDHALRYSYRNQPTIIWWNLLRLGEALGELMGAGANVDDPTFIAHGVTEATAPEIVRRAQALIDATAAEYKAVFLAEYKRLVSSRLGLLSQQPTDFDDLMSDLLDCLQAFELDFHHAFRRLSSVALHELETDDQRRHVSARFLRHAADHSTPGAHHDAAQERLARWLDKWRKRIQQDWGDTRDKEKERMAAMKAVNPNFVPRSWILDELIDRVENKGERAILSHIMAMALDPFADTWDVPGLSTAEQARFTGEVPRFKELMQCSCSS